MSTIEPGVTGRGPASKAKRLQRKPVDATVDDKDASAADEDFGRAERFQGPQQAPSVDNESERRPRRKPVIQLARPPPILKLAFTIDQFSLATGLARTRIFEAIRTGKLIAHKDGKTTIILREEGEQYLRTLPTRIAQSDTEFAA